MKVISCVQPFEMEIIKAEKPVIKDDNDVLIQIKRVGICGTDLHAFSGNQPFFEYPRTLGHELSGVVEAIGKNVKHVIVGDKVTIIPYVHCGKCVACVNGKTNCCQSMKVMGVHVDGGMAEYFIAPSQNVIQTNDLTYEQAATIEPLCIGAHAVRRAQIQPHDTVLVIGAGPIGLGIARFAKILGAKKAVIMDMVEQRLQFAQQWTEADNIILANEDVQSTLSETFAGELPTVVFDATGNKTSMENAFTYVNHGGKLIYVGLVKDSITFNDPDFHAKELTLFASRNATKEDFEFVTSCLEKGLIHEGYVTKEFQLDEVIPYFEHKNYQTNKAMIVFD